MTDDEGDDIEEEYIEELIQQHENFQDAIGYNQLIASCSNPEKNEDNPGNSAQGQGYVESGLAWIRSKFVKEEEKETLTPEEMRLKLCKKVIILVLIYAGFYFLLGPIYFVVYIILGFICWLTCGNYLLKQLLWFKNKELVYEGVRV